MLHAIGFHPNDSVLFSHAVLSVQAHKKEKWLHLAETIQYQMIFQLSRNAQCQKSKSARPPKNTREIPCLLSLSETVKSSKEDKIASYLTGVPLIQLHFQRENWLSGLNVLFGVLPFHCPPKCCTMYE